MFHKRFKKRIERVVTNKWIRTESKDGLFVEVDSDCVHVDNEGVHVVDVHVDNEGVHVVDVHVVIIGDVTVVMVVDR